MTARTCSLPIIWVLVAIGYRIDIFDGAAASNYAKKRPHDILVYWDVEFRCYARYAQFNISYTHTIYSEQGLFWCMMIHILPQNTSNHSEYFFYTNVSHDSSRNNHWHRNIVDMNEFRLMNFHRIFALVHPFFLATWLLVRCCIQSEWEKLHNIIIYWVASIFKRRICETDHSLHFS